MTKNLSVDRADLTAAWRKKATCKASAMLVGCTNVPALRSPSRCGDRTSLGYIASTKTVEATILADLVAEYIRDRLPWTLRERAAWAALPRDAALKRAAYGRDPWGHKHSHQHRLTDEALCEAVRLAVGNAGRFFGADDFESILALAREIQHQVYGLGPMWTYDFAERFGAHLEIVPVEFVYVQRGALDGARKLNLRVYSGRLVYKELPAELGVLDAADVENFLCINKARLSAMMLAAR